MAANPPSNLTPATATASTDAAEKAQAEKTCKENIQRLTKHLTKEEHTELEALSQELNPIRPELIKLITGHLDAFTLEVASQVIAPMLLAHKSDISDRQFVRENILPHVFGANPQGIKSLFESQSNLLPRLLLTKTFYYEGYHSAKLGSFHCFRRWRDVSPLQAAYLCGDGPFLGRQLLAYILRDNRLKDSDKKSLLETARQQLQEVANRIRKDAAKVNAEASVASAAAAAGAGAAAATTAAAATVLSSNDAASNKEKTELNSGSSANADEIADSEEFLSAIVKLINAYEAYTCQYDSLSEQSNLKELGRLWGEVCECHKRLYHYVHLEFFGLTPFSPLSPELFIAEPPRGPCRYYNNDNDLLDLDEIGCDTFIGLYKGTGAALRDAGGRPGVSRGRAQLDFVAINHLYKLRVDDLRNTIDHLRSLESALIFLNEVKPALWIEL